MEINSLSSSLLINSNFAVDKAKLLQQEKDFADRLKEITDAQDAADSNEDVKLRRVCQDLESVFLGLMFKQMRATVPKTGLMGGASNATEIYQSMLDDEMSKEMAKYGGIGLGKMMYEQLSRNKDKITTSPTSKPITQEGEE